MAKDKKPWGARVARKNLIRKCGEKKIFKTVDEAATYAAQFKGNMRVYPCRVCGEYHMTTNRDR